MGRVQNSFKGVIAGILFVIIGICVLWFNEGNNVKNIKGVAEAKKDIIQISSAVIDPANEGKLVATNGKLDVISENLADPAFGVSLKTAKLVRRAEMYQWEEKTETDDDGNKTYSYSKVWSESVINSQGFNNRAGHVNPSYIPYGSTKTLANDVKVGEFVLSKEQIGRLSENGNFTDLSQEAAKNLNMKIDGKYFTTAENLSSPEIGDIRVSFTYNNSNDISFLGKQINNTICDYTAKSGKVFNFIEDGIKDGQSLLVIIENSDKLLKWILRLVGLLCIIAGIGVVLKPISAISSYVPILGSIVGMATGLIALLLGGAIGLITIAIAWIRFRPVLGIGLLLLAVSLIVSLFVIKKKKQAVVEAPPQPGDTI